MKRIFSIPFFLVFSISSYASIKPGIVTALTWWNYLDKSWIKEKVYKECSVKLAIQSYKDANEFNKSFQLKDYDIAIFESTQLDNIKNEQEFDINSALFKLSKKYFPLVYKIYKKHNLTNNLSIFYMSNTVFLYNPKNISIDSKDNINSLINKLKQKKNKTTFVLLDDPIIISQIIKTETGKKMDTSSFKNTFNYEKFVVSNDFNNYKDLGVFITWSGEALYHKQLAEKKGINLEIATIPHFSFVTADILAQLTASKEAECVASLIGSKDFMERLQEDTYYYSPYMTFSSAKDPAYRKMYEDFYQLMVNDKLSWLLPSKQELNDIQSSWEQIILDYGL